MMSSNVLIKSLTQPDVLIHFRRVDIRSIRTLETKYKFRVHTCHLFLFLPSGEPASSQTVGVGPRSSEECAPATGEGPTSSHSPQDNDRVSLSQ